MEATINGNCAPHRISWLSIGGCTTGKRKRGGRLLRDYQRDFCTSTEQWTADLCWGRHLISVGLVFNFGIRGGVGCLQSILLQLSKAHQLPTQFCQLKSPGTHPVILLLHRSQSDSACHSSLSTVTSFFSALPTSFLSRLPPFLSILFSLYLQHLTQYYYSSVVVTLILLPTNGALYSASVETGAYIEPCALRVHEPNCTFNSSNLFRQIGR